MPHRDLALVETHLDLTWKLHAANNIDGIEDPPNHYQTC